MVPMERRGAEGKASRWHAVGAGERRQIGLAWMRQSGLAGAMADLYRHVARPWTGSASRNPVQIAMASSRMSPSRRSTTRTQTAAAVTCAILQ